MHGVALHRTIFDHLMHTSGMKITLKSVGRYIRFTQSISKKKYLEVKKRKKLGMGYQLNHVAIKTAKNVNTS